MRSKPKEKRQKTITTPKTSKPIIMYSYLDSSRCTQPSSKITVVLLFAISVVTFSLKSNFSFVVSFSPFSRSFVRCFAHSLTLLFALIFASLVCLIRFFISRSLTFNRSCCLSWSLAHSLMIHWRPRCCFASFFNLFRLDWMRYLRRVCSSSQGEFSRRTVLLSRLYDRREREIEEEEMIAP